MEKTNEIIKLNVNEKAVKLSELVIDDLFNKGLILTSITENDTAKKRHSKEYNEIFKNNNLKEYGQDFIKSFLIKNNLFDIYLEYVLSIDKYFVECEKTVLKKHYTMVVYHSDNKFTFKIIKSKYNELKERMDVQTLIQFSNNKPFYKVISDDLVNLKKNDLKDVLKVFSSYIKRKDQQQNGISIKDIQVQLSNDIDYIKELNNKNRDIITSSTMNFFKFKAKKEAEIQLEFEKKRKEMEQQQQQQQTNV